MTLLIAIVIGALVGWIASQIMGRSEGLAASIIIGIVGSFIGGLLSSVFTGTSQSSLGFSWTGIFWSLIGSIILVALLNAFTGWRTSTQHHA